MPTVPNAITSTTQQFLDIYDITNDVVLLKNGSVGLIITVTAMNFGLLAEEEQDAIIYGYAGLLNSLNYPIQIVIRSQTKDVTSYLNLLKVKEEETVNRIRKDQIRRYREFVSDLVQERNVLDKKFYVVIPATGLELGLVTAKSVVPGVKTPDISSFDRSVVLERARNLLEPKRDHLISQFARIGLSSRQLKTQELIQLFYTIYNTEASDGQKMTDSRNYTTAVVEGNIEEQVFGPTRAEQPESMTGAAPSAYTDTAQQSAAPATPPQAPPTSNWWQQSNQQPTQPAVDQYVQPYQQANPPGLTPEQQVQEDEYQAWLQTQVQQYPEQYADPNQPQNQAPADPNAYNYQQSTQAWVDPAAPPPTEIV